MTLTPIIEPRYLSLVGNPIRFKYMVPAPAVGAPNTVDVVINVNNKDINLILYPYVDKLYSAPGISYMIEFDLQSILMGETSHLHKVVNPDDQSVSSLNGELIYTVSFPAYTYPTTARRAIPGGITSLLFNRLIGKGSDIFADRLSTTDKMFLCTTRSVKDDIVIYRYSELQDVVFYHLDNVSYFLHSTSGAHYSLNDPDQADMSRYACFYWANLKEAYEFLHPEDGVMVMSVDGINIFKINVLPDPISEERYILLFRNSLGFMERVLITGEAINASTFEKGDVYINHYTSSVKYLRGNVTNKITVSTGYRLLAELEFLQDLLLSDEIYMLDDMGEQIACSVSADVAMDRVQKLPLSMDLTIEYAFKESRYDSHIQQAEMSALLIQENRYSITTEDGYLTTENN